MRLRHPLPLTGRPIEIRYQANLLDTAGNAAHAATFIRDRLIVLDEDLQKDSRGARCAFCSMNCCTSSGCGRETGAASHGKTSCAKNGKRAFAANADGRPSGARMQLRAVDVRVRTRAWREYCCESFCDTGAWFCGGGEKEVTLAPALPARPSAHGLHVSWTAAVFQHEIPI